MFKLNFKNRINIGFGFVFLLIVALLFYIITQLNSVSDKIELIYKHPFQVSNKIREIQIEIFKTVRMVRDIRLASNLQQLDSLINEIGIFEKKIKDDFKIIYSQYLGQKIDVDSTFQAFENWKVLQTKLYRLKIENKYDSIDKIIKFDNKQQVDKIIRLAKKISDFASQKAETAMLDAIQQKQNTSKTIILAIIITFLLIITISYVISRSITVPVKQFIKQAKAVFQTHSDVENIPFSSEEEMLALTIKELTNTYQEIEQQNEEIKSQVEQLANFNKVLESKVEERTFEIAQNEKKLIKQNQELLSAEEEIRASNEELVATSDALKNSNEELNRAIEKITKSEADLLEAQRISKIGNFYYKQSNKELIWSKNLYSIFDISENIVSDELFAEFLNRIQKDERACFKLNFDNAIESRQAFSLEFKIEINELIKSILMIAEPEFDSLQNLKGYKGIYQDISERKLIDSKLAGFSNILRTSLNEIYIFDVDTLKFIFVNNGALKNIGYTIDEMLNLTPIDIKPDYTFESFSNAIEPLKNGNIDILKFETVHQRKDGSLYNVYINLQINNFDGRRAFVAIILDVTDKKAFEKELILAKEKAEESEKNLFIKNEEYEAINEELRQTNEELFRAKEKTEESELKYRTIFENSPIGIFRSTKSGQFIEVNQALAIMLGYENPNEVLEKIHNIQHQIYVESKKRSIIIDQISKNEIHKFENVYKRKNGEHFYANLYIREITNEKDEKFLEGMVEETTDIKKKELELTLAKEKAEESDKLKSAFLQNMSHEIRTPLNAIVGFSELMTKPNLSAEKFNKFSELITQNSEKLITIITDVIEISQIHSNQVELKLTEINVISFIHEIFTGYKKQAESKNLDYNLYQQIPFDELKILIDGQKLKRTISHLIDNAIKFTKQGSVSVICNIISQNSNSLIDNNQTSLQISISDTGIGISEEMQRIIFEPFRQVETGIARNYGGNGLGLPIAKSYIELMKGSITIKSQINLGTTFTINLPLNSVVSNIFQITKEKNNRKINTVLIVEDEFSNYLFLEELLDDYNFSILYAENGQKAIDLARTNRNIDLIFMDIKMPVMDGHTAAGIIKEFRPAVPIIAQSAYALESEIEKYKDIFNDYITKPIKIDDLKLKLYKYL